MISSGFAEVHHRFRSLSPYSGRGVGEGSALKVRSCAIRRRTLTLPSPGVPGEGSEKNLSSFSSSFRGVLRRRAAAGATAGGKVEGTSGPRFGELINSLGRRYVHDEFHSRDENSALSNLREERLVSDLA